MSRNDTLILDGHTLTLETLEKVAREHRPVTLSSDGLARMAAARKLVDTAITEKKPVYGVTTGLGARVVEALDAETLADFSYKTVRGRAHAVGKPVPRETVRAAMTVRANTLLKGAAAASPAIAEHLVACLNAGITPVVGEIASIGAGDLVWNATMSLALIGEGPMEDAGGNVGPGSGIMKTAGITPLELGPRDGLALCNNASHSAALSGLSIASAKTMYEAVQSAAALSLEGFLANLSPFDGRVLALRPQPGQHNAATGIMDRLQESKLLAADTARRLQDPLSIRNIPQIHGAVDAALAFAGEAVTAEINGASDNPAALVEDGIIISAGAYHTPHLTNALETVSRSYVHLAMTQIARLSKMLSDRFTNLNLFLAEPGSDSNGFAPVMKTAEAAGSALAHAAQPVVIWPSVNADGVEDSLTATPAAARALMKVAKQASYLTAIELLVAAAAVEQRGTADQLGAFLTAVLAKVRSFSPPLREDRPLGAEIEAVATAVRDGIFGLTPAP